VSSDSRRRELPVYIADVEVAGGHVGGGAWRGDQGIAPGRTVDGLQSQQVGAERPRPEAKLALDVLATRPRDTRQLVPDMRRPQYVAVLSDDQSCVVNQLRRTDPARKHQPEQWSSAAVTYISLVIICRVMIWRIHSIGANFIIIIIIIINDIYRAQTSPRSKCAKSTVSQ